MLGAKDGGLPSFVFVLCGDHWPCLSSYSLELRARGAAGKYLIHLPVCYPDTGHTASPTTLAMGHITTLQLCLVSFSYRLDQVFDKKQHKEEGLAHSPPWRGRDGSGYMSLPVGISTNQEAGREPEAGVVHLSRNPLPPAGSPTTKGSITSQKTSN